MTQFRKGIDAMAAYVRKEFGGVAGPMAAKAIRTRNEPLVDDKPTTPEGEATVPGGSVSMIKWEDRLGRLDEERQDLERTDEPAYFNLIWAHTVEEMRAQLEARTERQDTLAEQDGVKLLRSLCALHHQQDDTKPSMMEVTNQD